MSTRIIKANERNSEDTQNFRRSPRVGCQPNFARTCILSALWYLAEIGDNLQRIRTKQETDLDSGLLFLLLIRRWTFLAHDTNTGSNYFLRFHGCTLSKSLQLKRKQVLRKQKPDAGRTPGDMRILGPLSPKRWEKKVWSTENDFFLQGTCPFKGKFWSGMDKNRLISIF